MKRVVDGQFEDIPALGEILVLEKCERGSSEWMFESIYSPFDGLTHDWKRLRELADTGRITGGLLSPYEYRVVRFTANKPPNAKTLKSMAEWLHSHPRVRYPGVKENLFALSGYVTGEKQVPSKETLTFLHEYIFALENVVYYQDVEIERLKKLRPPERTRPISKRPTRPREPHPANLRRPRA